jgi:hypothetical protein
MVCDNAWVSLDRHRMLYASIYLLFNVVKVIVLVSERNCETSKTANDLPCVRLIEEGFFGFYN